jgi:hypothetical protein
MGSDTSPDKPVGERFERLYEEWSRSVRENLIAYSSSDRDYTQNPSFDAIVDLGYDALPFIMERLRSDEGAHFLIHALARITGRRFPPEAADAYRSRSEEPSGNQAIAQLWLSWWDSRRDVGGTQEG